MHTLSFVMVLLGLGFSGLACATQPPTPVPSQTQIPTRSPTPTLVPPTTTFTVTPTPTLVPTATPTPFPTPTPPSGPTATPIPLPTPTPTSVPTATPTPLPTPTPVPTPIPPEVTVAAVLNPSLVVVTEESGVGLGFFVDVRDGSPSSDYILTNQSIVKDECRVTLQLPSRNGKRLASTVWGQVYARDDSWDLALIEIKAQDWPSVKWGDLGEFKVGDKVFAFELNESNKPPYNVVGGVIRDVQAPRPSRSEGVPGARFVSTDFDGSPEINFGPLVDLDGRVLAINSSNLDGNGKPLDRRSTLSLSVEGLIQNIPRLHQGGTVLTTTPSPPIAGRPVTFTILTQPYETVEVTHVDPRGEETAWIYPEDMVRYRDGEKITTRTFGADACGRVEWTRRGFRDYEGKWTVKTTVSPDTPNARTHTLKYTLEALESEPPEKVHMWTKLNRYQGPGSDAYYSDFVPMALAADLQAQMARTADFLEERLGARAEELQDVYLMGNRELFEQVERYMGIEPGWESGFYSKPCRGCYQHRPGIYIQADARDTESALNRILAHEYAHSLVETISKQKSEVLAKWINEGLAGWSEHEVGISGDRPMSAYRSMFRNADLVREAAVSGDLFDLSSLENRLAWKSREGDQVTLQYAQSYMAMRYLIETYGASAAASMIADLGVRGTLGIALETATGVAYREFESGFVEWLKKDEPTSSYYDKGIEHYNAGKYQEAVDQFSTLIGIDPSRAIAFRYRGRAYYQLNQYDMAIEDFDQAIHFDPADASGYNWRGNAYYKLKQYQRTLEDFDQAITLGPTAQNYTNRGSSYQNLKQYERAIQDFDQALRLDPDYVYAYTWRATAHRKLGSIEKARSDEAKACSLDKTYCD